MDDRAFFESLIDDAPRRRAGAEFLRKHAGFVDGAKAVGTRTAKLLKDHAPEIAGALAGAAALTAVQYHASKPGKSGTSAEQRMIAAMDQAHQKSVTETKAEGKEPGFASDLSKASIDSARPFSDLLAKHPGKGAALMAAPMGATTGWQLAKTIFK